MLTQYYPVKKHQIETFAKLLKAYNLKFDPLIDVNENYATFKIFINHNQAKKLEKLHNRIV